MLSCRGYGSSCEGGHSLGEGPFIEADLAIAPPMLNFFLDIAEKFKLIVEVLMKLLLAKFKKLWVEKLFFDAIDNSLATFAFNSIVEFGFGDDLEGGERMKGLLTVLSRFMLEYIPRFERKDLG